MAEQKRKRKDITLQTAASDAEAVWKYVLRGVSFKKVSPFRSGRSIVFTAAIA